MRGLMHIVYEQGGYLHLLNPVDGTTNQLVITVQGDMNFSRPRWESISGKDLSKRKHFSYRKASAI